MTLRLTVLTELWRNHLATTVTAYGEMVPVVKGNGYGFGRSALMLEAAKIAPTVAVGSVFEVADAPVASTAIVLTPAGIDLPLPLPKQTILTVGSLHHVATLRSGSWRGPVIIKLQSRMLRYGATSAELPDLLSAVGAADCTQVGWSVHPPLDGTPAQHRDDVSKWLTKLDHRFPIHVSHLDAESVQQLRSDFKQHHIVARVGTALWLGDKSSMKLHADVLDARAVKAGATAGYRNTKISTDGTIVLVGAGSAHGVHTVGDGLSPFHFRHKRLQLLEPSHMHTTMLFVAAGEPCPQPGDFVDVQQPLTRVVADTIYWT